ncbi:MAG: PHP domain-containing protein [Thermoplasmata archaeon]
MKFDLHIHSKYSRDASAQPSVILRRAKQMGLSGVAITDHNSIDGSFEARSLSKSEGVLVVSGSEVSTSDGHVLAYGVRELIPRGLSAAETVDRIRACGGIAVAAHPKRFPSGVGIQVAEKVKFDALEVLNGGSSKRANEAARKLAERLGRPGTGGSDAHKLDEVGRSYTLMEGVFTEDQALDAIMKGPAGTGGRSRTVGESAVYSVEVLVEWLKGGMNRL